MAEELAEELVVACHAGKASVVEELLGRRAQVNQATRDGATALTAACMDGNDS